MESFAAIILAAAGRPPLYRGGETYLKVVDADGANAAALLTEKVGPDGPGLELTAWR